MRYSLILADPPWPLGGGGNRDGYVRGPQQHYPTMTYDAIDAMGAAVEGVSAPDAFLLMWATSQSLPRALRTIEAWGFSYVSSAVWVKPSVGLGYYFRMQHEFLLLGKRGQPAHTRAVNDHRRSGGDRPSIPASVIHASRRGHSRKPEESYAMAETLSAGPYLEIFARHRRLGWDAWGNEVGYCIALRDAL